MCMNEYLSYFFYIRNTRANFSHHDFDEMKSCLVALLISGGHLPPFGWLLIRCQMLPWAFQVRQLLHQHWGYASCTHLFFFPKMSIWLYNRYCSIDEIRICDQPCSVFLIVCPQLHYSRSPGIAVHERDKSQETKSCVQRFACTRGVVWRTYDMRSYMFKKTSTLFLLLSSRNVARLPHIPCHIKSPSLFLFFSFPAIYHPPCAVHWMHPFCQPFSDTAFFLHITVPCFISHQKDLRVQIFWNGGDAPCDSGWYQTHHKQLVERM